MGLCKASTRDGVSQVEEGTVGAEATVGVGTTLAHVVGVPVELQRIWHPSGLPILIVEAFFALIYVLFAVCAGLDFLSAQVSAQLH